MEDFQAAFVQKVGKHRLLSHLEEIQLARKIRVGGPEAREAKERLIMHNMRLVLAIAPKYAARGVEHEDLVQSGVIGLNRAAELYDPDSGFRFSTYATAWVHQSIQRACQKSETIRVPDALRKVRLTDQNNPGLSPRELAERAKVTAKRALDARNAAHVTKSLDAPAFRDDDGESGSYADKIEDPNAPGPFPDAELDWLHDALAQLPALEREVLEMSFGLNGYGDTGGRTRLTDIADATGRSLKEVRAAREHGLKLLRQQANFV